MNREIRRSGFVFFDLVISLLLLSGCVHHVKERCPTCPVVDGEKPMLPRVRAGAKRLFVIVPGALGYGWEWDGAAKALGEARVPWFVFWWQPWKSLGLGAAQLHDVLAAQIAYAPRSLEEIVVIAHSAGGVLAAHAVGELKVPEPLRVRVVTIGAPFAGMSVVPAVGDGEPLGSPAMFATSGVLSRYPKLPPRVEVVTYVTSGTSDPVMKRRFGHDPAPLGVGPRAAQRIEVDAKEDHNHLVSRVVEAQLQVSESRAPPARR